MQYMESYQKWLKDFQGDQALVSDLTAIADNEKEIEDRFYTNLSFGTGGMRGVLGYGTNRMNIYTVRRATQGLANFLNHKKAWPSPGGGHRVRQPPHEPGIRHGNGAHTLCQRYHG